MLGYCARARVTLEIHIIGLLMAELESIREKTGYYWRKVRTEKLEKIAESYDKITDIIREGTK